MEINWAEVAKNSEELMVAFVTFLTTAFTVLLGLWCIAYAFYKMADYAKSERQGKGVVGPIVGNFLIGTMLVQFGSTVGLLVRSFFGSDYEKPQNAMNYFPASLTSTEVMQQAMTVVVIWVFALGFVAILRGLLIIRALASGHQTQKTGWSAFWHIIAGAICVNISQVIRSF